VNAHASQKKAKTDAILRSFHEEGNIAGGYDGALLKRLWDFVRPHRVLLYWTLVLGLVITAGGLIRPLIMRWAIDDGIMAKDASVLFKGAVAFGAFVIAEQLLQVVRVYSSQLLGVRVIADLRRATFEFLHTLRMQFFDRQPVGRLVTRVTSDTDAILELTASGALNLVTDLVKLIGIVVLMLSLDWQLSLVAFCSGPPVIWLVRQVRRRHREAFRDIRAKTARMNSTMNEQVSGMTVVQAFNRQSAAALEFDEINEGYREANIRSIKYDAMQDAAIEMVMAVCLASILVALGFHPVSFGVLVAFNAYVVEFFEPISALAQRYTILQSALAGAERVFGLFDTREADAVGPNGADVSTSSAASSSAATSSAEENASPARAQHPIVDGSSDLALEFSKVHFSYKPGVPVLDDVSFSAAPGEKIALVGPTGSGKTTIASLLLRLYEVESGHVRVFGKDVRSIDRETLRKSFAVVPQDVFLFPGTIADNVAVGDVPDLGRVRETLERIGAYDLLVSRAGGLSARIEERGQNFSVGERQLIAFARALYRDAPILLLDEATASVDSATESRLQAALNALTHGRTSIIIAHRLSTIQTADRIVVLQKGRVVEQGSHEQLLHTGGLYSRLHQLHFSRH
jgi:ATP-binding cassette subfamily B multidrug efflux pump